MTSSKYYEQSYKEIALSWSLQDIYADLEIYTSLTAYQKALIRGILRPHSPKDIAQTLSLSESTVKKDLSECIYPAFRDLGIDFNRWYEINTQMEKKGYRLGFKAGLEAISKTYAINSLAILSELRPVMVESYLDLTCEARESIDSAKSYSDTWIRQGDSFFEANTSQIKHNDYLNAIQLYLKAAKAAPFSNMGKCLLKIARCFEHLKAFKDCVDICDLAYQFTEDLRARSEIDSMMGASHYYLMLETKSIDDLCTTLRFFDQATRKQPSISYYSWNCVESWILFCGDDLEAWGKYIFQIRWYLKKFKDIALDDDSEFLINEGVQYDITSYASDCLQHIKEKDFEVEIIEFFDKYFKKWNMKIEE